METRNNDVLANVIGFLRENEEYGDDWSTEIAVLEELFTYSADEMYATA